MLPSVLLTAMVDIRTAFVTDVTDDTVKKLKRHLATPLTDMLMYYNIQDTTQG
jgi:hypothetical protein